MLDVRMFGETGSPQQSTTTLQRAIDWSATNQRDIILATRLDLIEPIIVRPNAGLRGLGAGFACGVRPINCPAFRLDGDLASGGWVFNVNFRDFCIWGERVRSKQEFAVQLNRCYRVNFSNVIARGYRVSDRETRAIFSFTDKQNVVVFDRVCAIGTQPSGTGCAFYLANDPDGGLVQFNQLDAENVEVGISFQKGSCAELSGPYFERTPVCMEISPGVRSIVSHGGIFRLTAGRAVGVLFRDGEYSAGEHIAFFGPTFQPSDEQRVHFAFKGPNAVWRNETPLVLEAVDWRQTKMSDLIRRAAAR